MIDEKINKTLSELESGLKNVESARKQVESTVNAYNGLNSTTEPYVRSLSTVKEKLSQIVELIGMDYDKKNSDFFKDREKIVTSCNAAINNINTAVEKISNDFSSTVNGINKKLNLLFALNGIVLLVIIILYFLLK